MLILSYLPPCLATSVKTELEECEITVTTYIGRPTVNGQIRDDDYTQRKRDILK